MNLIMSGLDFKTADIETREEFHVGDTEIGALARQIRDDNGLFGCVILSTCNRTEIYLSAPDDREVWPAGLLGEAIKRKKDLPENTFITRKGDEAVWHLMKMAAGLESQILGDDQILTQLKSAIAASREAGAADAVLETLFRGAITAGKRVKTETALGKRPASAAYLGVEAAERYFGALSGKRALVIGNGEMGRLVAGILVEKGAHVTVTLREYKYKPVTVPEGCGTISYGLRFEHFNEAHMIFSATKSPHYTITLADAEKCNTLPPLFIDLAVPRDIDPQVEQLGITLYNVDTLGGVTEPADKDLVYTILDRYNEKFVQWTRYRR